MLKISFRHCSTGASISGIENGFPEDFPRVSHFNEKRVYVRYPGGHVGFNKENIGLSFEQAKQGIEEAIVVANRFTTLFSFVSDHFTGGDFGTNPLRIVSVSKQDGGCLLYKLFIK